MPRQNLTIVGTELFGPVLSVLRFDDEDEVLQMANDSQYGLAAGVFTEMARGFTHDKAFVPALCGLILPGGITIAEFGGFKDSGYGRESGMQAIYDYTRPKTAWLNISNAPLGNPFVMR